jgi:hypothetical protein
MERRVEQVRSSYRDELNCVVDNLANLSNLEGWMVPGLIDAAVKEWESRIRDFIQYYDSTLTQSNPAAEAEARRQTIDDDPSAPPF